MIDIRFTVTNRNPNTIWNRLAAELGREPTNAECRDEVFRILYEAEEQRLTKGRGPKG